MSQAPAGPAAAVAWVTPTRLIMAVFFVQAFSLTNWFPRIPDVQARLGLGPAELSICLIGMSLGSFCVTFFTGPLVDRLSPRKTMLVGMVLFYVALTLPGWTWDAPSLFVALALMGASYVVVDVAMNVEAARIQETGGRRILSTCHGFWSLGSVAGSVIGAQFAQADVRAWLHLIIVAIVSLPVGLMLVRALPAMLATPVADRPRRPMLALPSMAMVGVCIYAFGVILAELTTRNWGAVYLRETIGTSAAATGWGLGIFSLMMAAGRLAGDRLTDRIGAVALGRICAATAVAGVLALVTAQNLPMALVGFAAVGLGVSVGFPLSVSAAAARGDRPPAINVATLSLIAYSGSLVGPPLVGFVAQGAGLRIGLATLLPLMVLSALFAGELRRKASAKRPVGET